MDRHTQTDRTAFIGGSDIGAIIGMSRFKTPLDVWLEKTGQAPVALDPDKEKIFRRGKRLEPVVLEMLLEEHGIETLVRNERYVDAAHPFMACEVDGEAIVEGEHVNIEAKTAHHFIASRLFGEEGTDDIDVSYAAQAMWGLGITGRRRTIFGVLVGADTLLRYEIIRDDETIQAMRARAVAFWHDHVLAGVPPEPVNLPDVLKLFRKLPASSTEATEEVAALVRELEVARQDKAVADEREVELKYQIGRFMLGESGILLANGGKIIPGPGLTPGVHCLTYGGAPILNVRLSESQRLDGERLKEEKPEVHAAFQKPISFFTFAKPRGKKR